MKWNANELAWAKKNNVTLGQKTKGGLMNVGAYRQSIGAGAKGGGGGGGGGGALAGYKQQQMKGPGGMYQTQGQIPQMGMKDFAKAGAVGAGAGAASIAMGGLGAATPLMAFGPVGIAAGAGLLALGILGKKKQPKTYSWSQDHQIQKGPSGNVYQAVGGANTAGAIATQDEWLSKARNFVGGAGGEKMGNTEWYENYRSKSEAALKAGDIDRVNELRTMHGFNAFVKEAPKVEHRARSAPAAVEEAPAPVQQPKREEVSKPGSGLEDTIKAPPQEVVERPGLRPGVNAYNVPKSRKRRAGFFSYGGSMS